MLDLDVVSAPLQGRIGNAVNVDQSAAAAQQAPAPAAAQRPDGFAAEKSPPPQQQQQQQQPPQQQQAFNNSRPSYQSRPVQRSPVSDRNLRSIEAINPYCSPWTIKAIVDSKGDMKTWNNSRGSGNLFSVTLKDKTGSIRATAFKEDADRLYKELNVGDTYLITRGQVKPANKRYCDFHEYEITFGRDTQVVAVSAGDLKIEYNII
eukprot:COSAG01_NODE_17846_length_1119_cov_42.553922_1_plen_205_part_10